MAGAMLIKTAILSHPKLFNDQESSFQTPGQQRLECELRSPRCEEQLPEKLFKNPAACLSTFDKQNFSFSLRGWQSVV